MFASPALLLLGPAAATELVVLVPGLGDTRSTRACMQSLADQVAPDGYEVVVADYQSRRSVEASAEGLARYFEAIHPERYDKVHVVAWILGGWSLNLMLREHTIPNLASVIYDRSPIQERAPAAVVRVARPFIWLAMGSLVRDLSRTPYPSWTPTPGVRVGLYVENRATSLMVRLRRVGESYGPLDYGLDHFGQAHDDAFYTLADHDRTYLRHDLLWPEWASFFATGRFSDGAQRTPYAGEPWQTPDLEEVCTLPG